jgi:hypothetical protein
MELRSPRVFSVTAVDPTIAGCSFSHIASPPSTDLTDSMCDQLTTPKVAPHTTAAKTIMAQQTK